MGRKPLHIEMRYIHVVKFRSRFPTFRSACIWDLIGIGLNHKGGKGLELPHKYDTLYIANSS